MPIIRGPRQMGTEVIAPPTAVSKAIVETPIANTPAAVEKVVVGELERPEMPKAEVEAAARGAEPLKPFASDLQPINPEEASYRLGPYTISRSVQNGHEVITITSGPVTDPTAPAAVSANKPAVLLTLKPKGDGPGAMVVIGLTGGAANLSMEQPAAEQNTGVEGPTQTAAEATDTVKEPLT